MAFFQSAVGVLQTLVKVAFGESRGNFANARIVRNFLESSIMNQADRLFGKDRDKLTDDELMTIEKEDVKNIA